jgi:DUF1680 family protein
MKRLLLSTIALAALTCSAQQDYPIHAVPFTQVQLTDAFWSPRIETNRTVTIPASFARCEETGRVKNFTMAAEHQGKFCTVYPFDDTDIYKTLEGASFSLAVHPDKKLDAYLDSLITIIGKAQEPDGYLYTARTIDPTHPHAWSGPTRWVKEHELSHELYNSGHLFEAAAAHYQATGKRSLLDIALKNADLLVATFGPDKMHTAPGHEIVEMGLVKLYRITGKKDYLDLAKFFLEQRGERQYNKDSRNPWENGSYWQAHKPVTQQDEVIGHAVRAMYLYSAMTDVAALTGDTAYVKAVDRLWENMITRKLYLNGGIGAIGDGERFGANYELPNTTAYAETCAAIGSVYWNYRMFLLHGDAKYMDILEKTLYNGLISGVGLDGKTFFYTNAMQVRNSFVHNDLEIVRPGWFTCSCCPTNVARLIPSVPGYIYAIKGRDVYVNLYISGTAALRLDDKEPIQLTQQSNYPWDGNIHMTVNTKKPADFSLMLRIPGWARNEAVPGDLYHFFDASAAPKPTLTINGQKVDYETSKGYAVVRRTWKKSDVIDWVLPMDIRRVAANEKVKDDIGKLALQRGPILYCAEWADNDGRTSNLILPDNATLTPVFQAGLLNGVMTLQGNGRAIVIDPSGQQVSTRDQKITVIPYYAWANRGKGEMNIWFPERIKEVDLVSSIPDPVKVQ